MNVISSLSFSKITLLFLVGFAMIDLSASVQCRSLLCFQRCEALSSKFHNSYYPAFLTASHSMAENQTGYLRGVVLGFIL